jgi:hypothetical protein
MRMMTMMAMMAMMTMMTVMKMMTMWWSEIEKLERVKWSQSQGTLTKTGIGQHLNKQEGMNLFEITKNPGGRTHRPTQPRLRGERMIVTKPWPWQIHASTENQWLEPETCIILASIRNLSSRAPFWKLSIPVFKDGNHPGPNKVGSDAIIYIYQIISVQIFHNTKINNVCDGPVVNHHFWGLVVVKSFYTLT